MKSDFSYPIAPHDQTLLQAGRNCWRIEPADRIAFLIDGADYFKAFYEAVAKAQRSILIVGWDINSRVRLLREERPGEYPAQLGDFLNAVVAGRKELHAHVLIWDFAMIYALEREWLPIYRLGWRTHRRLHFRLDDKHPAGASLHQKIVVVDDKVAFVGGFDLTKWRWDTPDHRPDDARRQDPDGVLYPPFHDVQLLVSGKAAAALGQLVRERWRRVTGQRLAPPHIDRRVDPWPDHVKADIQQAEVAIARTDPAYKQYPEIFETERLYLDAIAAAEYSIYIENQYFTSLKVGQALADRLEQEAGPEVVIVLPRRTSGWLEQNTMDVLRGRLLKKIRSADRYGRLKVYYPDNPALGGSRINVHSKVLVVDDKLVRIGSSNLSNRSMRLDIECDLAIESGSRQDIARAIGTFRNRLLAEHLDTRAERVGRALSCNQYSLIAALESLRSSGRSLQPLEVEIPADVDVLVPEAALVDPERPMKADLLINQLIDEESHRSVSRRLFFSSSLILLLIALVGAWRLGLFEGWLAIKSLFHTLRALANTDYAPLLGVGSYLLGGLLFLPVNLLVIATLLIFEPVSGFFYALIGSFLSALTLYGIGRMLGRRPVRRLVGSRLNRISRHLARQGIVSMIAIRMLPIASFTLINLVAGASRIHFRNFALGTFIGMIPGILAMTVLVSSIKAAVAEPGTLTYSLLAGVIIAITLAVLAWRRWLLRRKRA